jgi:crotonobetainyl-CoA:carnitine CoA-transferase CaiB-like acyl-CoA transferase
METMHNTRRRPMPLEGIKIVEYGVFHAGPGAGAILSD